MNSIIDRLANLKPWLIFTLGVVTSVVVITAITLVAHLCYSLFPEGWGFVATGHFLAVGLAAWYLPKPFLDAYWRRKAMERLAVMFAEMGDVFARMSAGIVKPPLDVFDDEDAK